MRLKDLLSKEIEFEFDKHLHISEKKIKKYIHKWPDQIYDIVSLLQKKNSKPYYIFPLPNGEGTLEFKTNKKTKRIDIYFYDKNTYKIQQRFKHLLGQIYEDLLLEEELNSLREGISDLGVKNLDEVDKMIEKA